MTPEDHATAAEALFEAEERRSQIGLLSRAYPGMTLDDAYAVQAALVARKRAAGLKPIGWKIGLTSRAMQAALQIDTPDSGVLFDDMLFETGAEVPAGRFIQPRVEAEIAFLLGSDLTGPGLARADVLAATEAVAPSLEILDTRILRRDPDSGQPRVITDTVAGQCRKCGHRPGR